MPGTSSLLQHRHHVQAKSSWLHPYTSHDTITPAGLSCLSGCFYSTQCPQLNKTMDDFCLSAYWLASPHTMSINQSEKGFQLNSSLTFLGQDNQSSQIVSVSLRMVTLVIYSWCLKNDRKLEINLSMSAFKYFECGFSTWFILNSNESNLTKTLMHWL